MKVATPKQQFYDVVSAAIADFTAHGFDSQARLDKWMEAIRVAARQALVPEAVLNRALHDSLVLSFKRSLTDTRLKKAHPELSRFTIEAIKPKLRGELDRRILAGTGLIKLNKVRAVEETLQRFAGWATSIPIGGSRVTDRAEETKKVRRGIAGLDFVTRRCVIDQSHKLAAAIDDIIATDGGAIAGEWDHVMEGGGYQARPAHEARDGKIFLIRDSWALQDGFIRKAGHQYTDEIEQPGELVFCRCKYRYIYSIGRLPRDILTQKGERALSMSRAAITRANHRVMAAYG